MAVQSEIEAAARPWLRPVASAGYATKGLVYVLVGWLSVLAALGWGGRLSGQREAVHTLGHQPLGEALLVAVGIGFAAYALWCLVRAVLNVEHRSGMKGVTKRVGAAITTLIYAGLSLTAFQLALREPTSSHAPRTWVARVMEAPFGGVLVGVAAAVIFVYGVVQIWRGVTDRFLKELDLGELGSRALTAMKLLGRVGLCARGTVFGVVAYCLLRAALEHSPGQTRDLAGALRAIATQPHGTVLVGLVATGLVAYGLYTLVSARYLRVPP